MQLTKPDGAGSGYGTRYPMRLPGTDDLLFSFWGQTFYTAVFSPKTGTWRAATPGKSIGGATAIGVYADNGYLLLGDGAGGMTAVAWNPSVTTPKNPDTVVIDRVYWIIGNERIWFNVSANGTAVYAPGSPLKRHLVWVDRKGGITQLTGEGDSIKEAVLSRDGTRVVRSGRMSQWVEDMAGGTRTRIESDLLTCLGRMVTRRRPDRRQFEQGGRLGSLYGQRQRQWRDDAALQEAVHAASDVGRGRRLGPLLRESPGHRHGPLDVHTRRPAPTARGDAVQRTSAAALSPDGETVA